MQQTFRIGLSDYLQDEEATRELAVLVDEMTDAGVKVERTDSDRISALHVSINKDAVPFAKDIGQWLDRTIERGKASGRLEPVPSKFRITDKLKERLCGIETIQRLDQIMDLVNTFPEVDELPGAVQSKVLELKTTIAQSRDLDTSQTLWREFLGSLQNPASSEFYGHLYATARIGATAFIQLVSDATTKVQSLGLHVSLEQRLKKKQIMALDENGLMIPLAK